MKHILRILFLLLLPIASATSCIKESFVDCPPEQQQSGLWITFDMLNTSLKYTTEVRHVNLFFYHPSGELARFIQYEDTSDLRMIDYAAFVDSLPPGDYHLLAVSNCSVYTLMQSYDEYGTVFTSLDNFSLNFQPICFMTGEIDLTVLPDTLQTENVTLLRHNNDIAVYLHYDGYSPTEGMELDARIYGNNGQFDYKDHTTVEDIYAHYADWGQL